MKKISSTCFFFLLLPFFLSSCIDPEPEPEPLGDAIEWYYLADLECISIASEAPIGEFFLTQLLALSDDELRTTLENADNYIDVARQFVNEHIRDKRDRLIVQNAYRFWEDAWPSAFSVEIRGRDASQLPFSEAYIITDEKVYLLWPFDVQDFDLEDEWNTRTSSLFSPSVLPYDPENHLLGSSFFSTIDLAIEAGDDIDFNQNVITCQEDFDRHEDSERLHECIKAEVDAYSGGALNIPSFVRFSARVDSPLVATLLERSADGRLDFRISPNPSGTDTSQPIPQYPDGRLQP